MARHISEEEARNIIAAVGMPPIPDAVLGGEGTVAGVLSHRLSETTESYDQWCFLETQNAELAIARAALDVEKKALKLLAAIGPIDEGGVPTRRELGRGSMYSYALLKKAEDPSRNFEQAVRGVARLAKWAGAARGRADADLNRKQNGKRSNRQCAGIPKMNCYGF
jgi:hypothetical protein